MMKSDFFYFLIWIIAHVNPDKEQGYSDLSAMEGSNNEGRGVIAKSLLLYKFSRFHTNSDFEI